MGKKRASADVAKQIEKQARAKAKEAGRSETRKSKGGELDTRESKAMLKFS